LISGFESEKYEPNAQLSNIEEFNHPCSTSWRWRSASCRHSSSSHTVVWVEQAELSAEDWLRELIEIEGLPLQPANGNGLLLRLRPGLLVEFGFVLMTDAQIAS